MGRVGLHVRNPELGSRRRESYRQNHGFFIPAQLALGEVRPCAVVVAEHRTRVLRDRVSPWPKVVFAHEVREIDPDLLAWCVVRPEVIPTRLRVASFLVLLPI